MGCGGELFLEILRRDIGSRCIGDSVGEKTKTSMFVGKLEPPTPYNLVDSLRPVNIT